MEKTFSEAEHSLIESRQVFGLTGGMGSGKSTVSEGFVARGAAIVDADLVVREIQEPGEIALTEMVHLLGNEILNDDETLNRGAAAEKMFSDPDKRTAVETVLKPHIMSRMFSKVSEVDLETTIVLDVPLLLEAGWHRLPLLGVIVVDTSTENAIDRLIEHRGFSREEAEKRISIQMPRMQKIRYADHVIPNNGGKEDLELEIEKAWTWMNVIRNFGKTILRGDVLWQK